MNCGDEKVHSQTLPKFITSNYEYDGNFPVRDIELVRELVISFARNPFLPDENYNPSEEINPSSFQTPVTRKLPNFIPVQNQKRQKIDRLQISYETPLGIVWEEVVNFHKFQAFVTGKINSYRIKFEHSSYPSRNHTRRYFESYSEEQHFQSRLSAFHAETRKQVLFNFPTLC